MAQCTMPAKSHGLADKSPLGQLSPIVRVCLPEVLTGNIRAISHVHKELHESRNEEHSKAAQKV